eukprot:3751573-Alexandrium_andersonii.AAC.1
MRHRALAAAAEEARRIPAYVRELARGAALHVVLPAEPPGVAAVPWPLKLRGPASAYGLCR